MRFALVLVAALFLAGCNGGTVDRHALTNDASTLDSINCEAQILADGIARSRVTVYFAREQAEELQLQTSNLADALSKRPTASGIEQRVRAKAKDAAIASGRLKHLHDHPSDRSAAARLAGVFGKAGSCA